MLFCSHCPEGKKTDTFLVTSFAQWLDSLPNRKLTLQGDSEAALMAILRATKAAVKVCQVTLRQTSVGDKQANGSAERGHQTVLGIVRTLLSDVGAAYETEVTPTHVLWPWAVRHAAFLANRFQPHAGGSTSFQDATGVKYHGSLLTFGETCMYHESGDAESGQGNRAKWRARWSPGIFVGKTARSDANVVLTPTGFITCRSVRRVAGESQADKALFASCRGVPWDRAGTMPVDAPPGPLLAPPHPEEPASGHAQDLPRRGVLDIIRDRREAALLGGAPSSQGVSGAATHSGRKRDAQESGLTETRAGGIPMDMLSREPAEKRALPSLGTDARAQAKAKPTPVVTLGKRSADEVLPDGSAQRVRFELPATSGQGEDSTMGGIMMMDGETFAVSKERRFLEMCPSLCHSKRS